MRNREVRFALCKRHLQPGLSGPKKRQYPTSSAGQDREGGTAGAGAPRIISDAAEPLRAIVLAIENIGLSPGRSCHESARFLGVLHGAAIAWSLGFPDAGGQELRKVYRVGFLTLSQLK